MTAILGPASGRNRMVNRWHGVQMSLEELERLVLPDLKEAFIVDPHNLPGFVLDSHVDLGAPWRIELKTPEGQAVEEGWNKQNRDKPAQL
jgi:hypothetical protein